MSLLTWATTYFKDHAIDSPRSTAEILLAYALGRTRLDLYLRYDQPLIEEELAAFKILIKRRLAHEPVAYIVGEKEFFSLAFRVSPAVLIPRPETECLVERIMDIMDARASQKPLSVLDLGTGSGALVISLASERPGHLYYASDLSIDALRMARFNAVENGQQGRIQFFAGTYLDATNGPFDLIVSNPPYVRHAELKRLQPEIRNFEPKIALDGGPDGLDAYRQLIQQAPAQLAPGGMLVFEIGGDQKAPIQQLASGDDRYDSALFYEDYAGIDRVAQLQLKKGLND